MNRSERSTRSVGRRSDTTSSAGPASRKSENRDCRAAGCVTQRAQQNDFRSGAKLVFTNPLEAATETGCHLLYPRSCSYNQRSAGVAIGYVCAGWMLVRSLPAACRFVVEKCIQALQRSPKDSSGISSATVTRKPDRPPGASVKENKAGTRTGKHKNHHSPDPNATGAHSVWRRTDPENPNRVSSYETYQPQSNPRNPNPWESVKRFDGVGVREEGHHNKVLDRRIPEPHIHDPKYPGVLREPEPWEFPSGY